MHTLKGVFSWRKASACFIKLSEMLSQCWDLQMFLVLFSNPYPKAALCTLCELACLWFHVVSSSPISSKCELFWQRVSQSTTQCPSSSYAIASSSEKWKLPWDCDYVEVNIIFWSLFLAYLEGVVSIHESWHLGSWDSYKVLAQTSKAHSSLHVCSVLTQDSQS